MTIVASFYAPRPGHPLFVYDYMDCLRVQHESCKRFGCTQIVITDSGVALGDLNTFNPPMPHDLMPAIIAGQLALLATEPDEDLLLIGADGLLYRDPADMFDGTFDLGVTTHPFTDCILNTGLIAVPAGKGATVAPIWRKALELCGTNWGDDQLSLAEVIKPTLEHGVEDRDGVRVKFMPVPGFNDAPGHDYDAINSLIVHFRGPRKRWMRAWAERFAR